MPISVIITVVTVLMVIGIISLCDALLRIIIRSKNDTDTVVVLALLSPDNTEQAVDYAIKRHPAAKIIVKSFTAEGDKRVLEIVKKKYPEILVEKE